MNGLPVRNFRVAFVRRSVHFSTARIACSGAGRVFVLNERTRGVY